MQQNLHPTRDPQDLTPTQGILFKYTIGLWLGTAYWLIGVPVNPPLPITRMRRLVSTIRGCVLSVGSFYWGMRAGPLWQCLILVAAALTIGAATGSMYAPSFAIDDRDAASIRRRDGR